MNPEEVLSGIESFAAARIAGELTGGPTSNSYLLKLDNDQFVLRLDTAVAAALRLDRFAEAKILAYISQSGLGPKPEYIAPEQGILITRYIEGRAWSDVDLHDAGRIQKLALLLRRLHALKPIGQPFNLHDRITNYARIIGTAEGRELADDTQWRLREFETDSSRQCLCHNDLISANIIEGEELALIDWEYAAIGDPFFDLATIAEHHQFDNEESELLLGAYFNREHALNVSRLNSFRALYTSLMLLWCASIDQLCEISQEQQVQLQQQWCRWFGDASG